MIKNLFLLLPLTLFLFSCGDDDDTIEYRYAGIEILGKHTITETSSGIEETELNLDPYTWEEYHITALEAPLLELTNVQRVVIDGENVDLYGVDENGMELMTSGSKAQWESNGIPALYNKESNGDYTLPVCTYLFRGDQFGYFSPETCEEIEDMPTYVHDYFINKSYGVGDTLSVGNFRVRYALQ